jgi:hypothetical protein
LAFDTAAQNAYWYVDQTWPTEGGNGGIAAGDYTLNMYFNERPRSWWDANYQYRQQITITAGTTAVPTSYSVRVQFDHAALVTGSKSLSSGNDIRIVYWNGSGWTELDRRLDDQSSWNSTTTQVWFRTQAAIGASASDSNYYIYYGYSSAGTPPTTWSNVFLFYDDFNDSSLDTARWTCTGTCTESGTTLVVGISSNVWATATYAIGTDTRWDGRLLISGSYNNLNYFSASDTVDYTGNRIRLGYSSTGGHFYEVANPTVTRVSYTPTTPTSYHIYAFNREGTTGVRLFQDSTQIANVTTTIPTGTLRMLLRDDSATAGRTMTYDWVRVRRYVSPEPTTAFGAEATSGDVRIVVTVSHTASDGLGATTIVTSSTITINSSTANPYALSIGSGSAQTFTSGDPRRLRVQVNVSAVNGGERFVLAYDSGTNPSNLLTPLVTVPESAVALIPIGLLIPLLVRGWWRGPRARRGVDEDGRRSIPGRRLLDAPLKWQAWLWQLLEPRYTRRRRG